MPDTPSLVDRFEAVAALGATLPDYAAGLGLDLEPIARSIGIDTAHFSDPFAYVGLDRLCRLFEAMAVLTRNETFGLDLAATFKAGMSGAYGYGLMSAPTFGSALRFSARHIGVVVHLQRCELVMGEDTARLEWSYSPLIVRKNQFLDFATALHLARFGDILGPEMRRAVVALERPPPGNVAAYRRRMAPSVSFSNDVNSVSFPQSLLDIANPRADPRLFRLMDEQCAALARRAPGSADMLSELKLHIVDRMAAGVPTLSEAARHLGLSERTLQRRLADRGTSLNDLIDEARRDIALMLLRDGDEGMSEIARRLGFSHASALTRSARRWFGRPPMEIRKKERDGSTGQPAFPDRNPETGHF